MTSPAFIQNPTLLSPITFLLFNMIIRKSINSGIISGLNGSENFLDTGHILCGTPKIYAGLAKLCAREIAQLVP